jgi:hypothetical protein
MDDTDRLWFCIADVAYGAFTSDQASRRHLRKTPDRIDPAVGGIDEKGHSTKSLRSSPLRGVVSREACNKPRG